MKIKELFSKKVLTVFAVLFLTFIGYRSLQMWNWLEKHPNQHRQHKPVFSSIMVRKLHVLYDTISQPKEYIHPMIQAKGALYNGSDTIYLDSKKREIIEFEIVGDSGVVFNEVDLVFDRDNRREEEKPHINKKEDCYNIQTNKALFAFRPWIYTSDLNNLLEVKLEFTQDGYDSTATFPILVLDSKSYDKHISNRLSKNQRTTWNELKIKYAKRLTDSWQMNRIGTGRRSYFRNQVSVSKFFAGKKYHSGLFTNEYIARDGDFKITLYIDYSPSIVIEPTD